MRSIVVTLCIIHSGSCLTAPAAWSAPTAHTTGTQRPNILFIVTDDQSYRTVSCYEGAEPWVRTPNIDLLAERGVRFANAYIGTWCAPSRATMLTGLHSYGVQTLRRAAPYPRTVYDPAVCRFWPAELRKHGYQTAQIGKWHTGDDAGYGRDWDYQMVWNTPKYTENNHNYYYGQLISHDGAEATIAEGYSTDNYTQWAVDYVRGANRSAGQPWFLWLCYSGVHAGYVPAERHEELYPDAKVAVPGDIYPPRPGKPEYMQKFASWERGSFGEPVLRKTNNQSQSGDDGRIAEGRSLAQWVRQYNQAVASLDEGVGRLMVALEESGQVENTLVVFTSDQGYAWGQHGFRHKLAPYDANLRAPLIISMPGRVPKNQVCRAPVGGVDLVPTLLGFAGVAAPWPMHGHDLRPLLQSPAAIWPHPAFIVFTGDRYGTDTNVVPPADRINLSGVPWYLMLRSGDTKYIRTLVGGETEELYDLDADPEELTNLADYADQKANLVRMRSAAESELIRTGAEMAGYLPPTRQMLAEPTQRN